MKSTDQLKSNGFEGDEFDSKIREALRDEGVIIPKTIEDVRRAKSRLLKSPVTVPPHLRDPSVLLEKFIIDAPTPEATNIVPCPSSATSKRHGRNTSAEFVEAVLIAQLTRLLATPEWPLGRLRYNKLAYLSHRKAEEDVTEHYLKKAAGPYSPWAKYQGPETIALKNGYVKRTKAGPRQGLVIGENISKIDPYLSRYPVCCAIEWIVGQFRFRKNDELELLATVDFAALDLINGGMAITLESIKEIIATNKEWAPKLKRDVFSDLSIERALGELRSIFPTTYSR